MPRQLKVFRTPIGFHDAYVAAPSRKAALQAWGSDADLFARGMAEIVTDPALTADPLAQPGVVIRRTRGSVAEHFAALPADKARAPAKRDEPPPTEKAASAAKPIARKPKARPRPSRATLDAAQDAVDRAERDHRDELAALRCREEALARERRATEARQSDETAKLADGLSRAQAAYDRAIARWQG
ncbi:hypothetical protein QH494_23985 [Sphingomonas sp. AR_OL41]|jgi:hypothetical protein|uniref:hypothetical protein n=1 Tax=Sphingomonas sp. AR_OL41 TaxID=3042729 RepID=UPI0024808962|nr:hypothetical protein [Sphingomonas sp. AR_OL41]MDH7975257.1 hypothetical protein [Sphingomonas sp. AR_OL41]